MRFILFFTSEKMAQHSKFNDWKGRLACGMPLIPFRTKLQGPANQSFQAVNQQDIIDEAFKVFRINVLFKNFQIKGQGDKVLIYVLVLLSHLFKITDNVKDMAQITKKLSEVNSLNNPFPKEKGNFLAAILEDGNQNEQQVYMQYIKQLKAETINRFLGRFFQDNLPIEDFKFWSGLAKKKFMGLNFVSLY